VFIRRSLFLIRYSQFLLLDSYRSRPGISPYGTRLLMGIQLTGFPA
jgi:hypothetical protein